MLAVSAIIGVILGTIFFGILMHRFTYYVPAKDAIGFFIRKWMMCCGVGIFIVYALLTIIGEILEPILPWLLVIGGIIAIIIVILVAVAAVSKAAEKKSSGEEKIKNPQPEQSSPAGKMQKETGITTPSTPQPIREIPLQQNQETVQNRNDKVYATAALTLGIISVAMTPCGILGGILGLIGLIFAVLVNEKSTKRGWALGLNIAGMSIGIIATIIWFGLLMS